MKQKNKGKKNKKIFYWPFRKNIKTEKLVSELETEGNYKALSIEQLENELFILQLELESAKEKTNFNIVFTSLFSIGLSLIMLHLTAGLPIWLNCVSAFAGIIVPTVCIVPFVYNKVYSIKSRINKIEQIIEEKEAEEEFKETKERITVNAPEIKLGNDAFNNLIKDLDEQNQVLNNQDTENEINF